MFGLAILNRRKDWRRIRLNILGGTSTTGNATSYNTSTSYLPTANALVLAFVIVADAAPIDDPSLDGTTNGFVGNGKTNWTSIANVSYDTLASPSGRLYVFRYMSEFPTLTTGTFNWSAGGTGCIIAVMEFVNVDTSGSEGSGSIVQVVTDRQDATANPSVSLATLNPNGRNAVVACVADDVNSSTDAEPEAGWNELSELSFANPTTGGQFLYKIETTDNTISTTATSRNWAIAAIEIKALPN